MKKVVGTPLGKKSLEDFAKAKQELQEKKKALEITDGGKDDDSDKEDEDIDPNDAGNEFGGRSIKKDKKKILLIGCWCMLLIFLCIILKY